MPKSAMEQFTEAKAQSKQILSGATVDEAFELGFWKGRLAGIAYSILSTKEALDGKKMEVTGVKAARVF